MTCIENSLSEVLSFYETLTIQQTYKFVEMRVYIHPTHLHIEIVVHLTGYSDFVPGYGCSIRKYSVLFNHHLVLSFLHLAATQNAYS